MSSGNLGVNRNTRPVVPEVNTGAMDRRVNDIRLQIRRLKPRLLRGADTPGIKWLSRDLKHALAEVEFVLITRLQQKDGGNGHRTDKDRLEDNGVPR